MTKKDYKKILRYLREAKFVIAKMQRRESETVYIASTEPFVVDGGTFTVVFVPGYGCIHAEAFMQQCKEIGVDTD